MPKPKLKSESLIAENRKAGFEVAVDQTMEAGLVLTGDEIKSIRAHRAQLSGGYVKFLAGRPVLIGLHLSQAAEPERIRNLLLHKKEAEALRTALQANGQTVVPLKLYLSHGWAKLLIGVGAGRKNYQKRELLRERDLDREANAELKRRRG